MFKSDRKQNRGARTPNPPFRQSPRKRDRSAAAGRLFPVLLLAAMLILLPGCTSAPAGGADNEPVVSAAERPETDSVTTAVDTGTDNEQELQRYLDTYAPQAVYQDCLLESRYLLITDWQIVTLFIANGYSACAVIDAADIVSVEGDTVGDLAFLKITDKAQATYEMTLLPEQIDQAMAEITALSCR